MRVEPAVGGATRNRLMSLLSMALMALGFAVWIIKPVGDFSLIALGYAAVGTGSMIAGWTRGFAIDRRVAAAFVATIFVGLVGGVVGLVRGNPGVGSELVFFVLLPLIWLVFAPGIDRRLVQVVVNVLPFLTLAIGVFGVLFWLDATERIEAPWLAGIPLGQSIGEREYGYQMILYPLPGLVFLLPFLFFSAFVPATYTWLVSRVVTWPALVSGLVLIFVAGRRALLVSFVISVVIGAVFLLRGAAKRRERIRLIWLSAIAAVVVTAIVIVTRFSPAALLESLGEEFAPGSIRFESGVALAESWLASPLLGHGLGATVPGLVRSVERPWDFELQYLLVLNAIGLYGTVVLALVTLWLLVMAVRTYRAGGADSIAPLFVGTVAVLIANASNPYLHTPGHYWMLFLLVLAVNAALRPHALGWSWRTRRTALAPRDPDQRAL